MRRCSRQLGAAPRVAAAEAQKRKSAEDKAELRAGKDEEKARRAQAKQGKKASGPVQKISRPQKAKYGRGRVSQRGGSRMPEPLSGSGTASKTVSGTITCTCPTFPSYAFRSVVYDSARSYCSARLGPAGRGGVDAHHIERILEGGGEESTLKRDHNGLLGADVNTDPHTESGRHWVLSIIRSQMGQIRRTQR
jgi:hypothetical protein